MKMIAAVINISSIVLFSGFYSCSREELSSKEFITRVAEMKNFNKKQETTDYNVSCSYRPAEWLALKEMNAGKDFSKTDMEKLKKETDKFSKALYFDFIISSKEGKNIVLQDVENKQDYATRISELTYRMHTCLSAVNAHGDTLKPITADFINTYGMSPQARFTVLFPKKLGEKDESFSIVYQDKIFGINAPLKFEFNAADMHGDLPRIKRVK